jgi:hypothetical protein
MRALPAVGALLVACATPGSSIACSYAEPDLKGLEVRLPRLAEAMTQEAATVELVRVSSTEPFTLEERWRGVWSAELAGPEYAEELSWLPDLEFRPFVFERTRWITFRVVERLKGSGSSEFTWSAVYDEQASSRDTQRDFEDPLSFNHSPATTFLQSIDEGSCANAIWAGPNVDYLVFRDAAGNLLQGPLVVSDRDSPQVLTADALPVFEPVSPRSIWLSTVKRAAGR